MKTDKTKLLQDIEAMKEKLASMEEELNKPEKFKHFPSSGDKYFFCTPWSEIKVIVACDNDIKPNTYKTREEAQEAYRKAVALEKIKRRIIELQGDWKPNWKDNKEAKVYIRYWYRPDLCTFEASEVYFSQSIKDFPFMKSIEIAETIINEMEDELKLIFDIS